MDHIFVGWCPVKGKKISWASFSSVFHNLGRIDQKEFEVWNRFEEKQIDAQFLWNRSEEKPKTFSSFCWLFISTHINHVCAKDAQQIFFPTLDVNPLFVWLAVCVNVNVFSFLTGMLDHEWWFLRSRWSACSWWLLMFCLEEQCCGVSRWLLELMTLVLVMDVRNDS
jgi:hypothetical protein